MSMFSIAAVLTLGVALMSFAESSEAEKPETFVKVEVQGRLQHGVFAIGGETTGTTISADKITLELDLQDNQELLKTAEQLNGKLVAVTGQLYQINGPERGPRWIVKVKTLQAAS